MAVDRKKKESILKRAAKYFRGGKKKKAGIAKPYRGSRRKRHFDVKGRKKKSKSIAELAASDPKYKRPAKDKETDDKVKEHLRNLLGGDVTAGPSPGKATAKKEAEIKERLKARPGNLLEKEPRDKTVADEFTQPPQYVRRKTGKVGSGGGGRHTR